MSKTKFKYLLSMFITLLSVNFLLFTTGSFYLNQGSIPFNYKSQNSPQKRSFSSAHGLIAKYQTENNQDTENQSEDDNESNEQTSIEDAKHCFQTFFLSITHGSFNYLNNNYCFYSNFNQKTTSNALYIVFRVFRL